MALKSICETRQAYFCYCWVLVEWFTAYFHRRLLGLSDLIVIYFLWVTASFSKAHVSSFKPVLWVPFLFYTPVRLCCSTCICLVILIHLTFLNLCCHFLLLFFAHLCVILSWHIGKPILFLRTVHFLLSFPHCIVGFLEH